VYDKTLMAGWGDMDFNSHMKNTTFHDKSGDVRMMFFVEHGFPMREFARLKIGTVIQKNSISSFWITLAIAGLSEDGSRWLMRNEFFRPDGKLAAKVTGAGGWLDVTARKLVAAPADLLPTLNAPPRTSDFRVLRRAFGRPCACRGS
jgi:acyl-CoA thioester hydrolase